MAQDLSFLFFMLFYTKNSKWWPKHDHLHNDILNASFMQVSSLKLLCKSRGEV